MMIFELKKKKSKFIEEAYDYTKKNYRPQDKRQGATISDLFENDLAL